MHSLPSLHPSPQHEENAKNAHKHRLNMDFRFTLQKYAGIKSRFNCPACGKARVFTRYIDQESGEQLGDHVGRCNRELECGYHFKPAEYFKDNIEKQPCTTFPTRTKSIPADTFLPTSIPIAYLEKSLNPVLFKSNHFVHFLQRLLGNKWQECVKRFYIGSSKSWSGNAVVFWQVDSKGVVRSGKIMDYDPDSGRRIKGRITWVHSELQKKNLLKDFALNQCLFGEHQLIKEPFRAVGIVESEKTAVIASAYMPDLTWMACGSINGISPDKFKSLQNSTIVLYPDIKGYEKWRERQDGAFWRPAGSPICLSRTCC